MSTPIENWTVFLIWNAFPSVDSLEASWYFRAEDGTKDTVQLFGVACHIDCYMSWFIQ